jgi:hypothetical protein
VLVATRQSPDWKVTNSISVFFDHNHGAGIKVPLTLGENLIQSGTYRRGRLVMQSKYNYAWKFFARGGQQVTEIQIESQYDAAFCTRLIENLRVFHPEKAFVPKMNCVVTGFTKRSRRAHGYSHVGQKLHE